MAHTLLLALGILNFVLIIIATVAIIYSEKMTSIGKILRTIEILVFPLIGPFIILIEVLNWRLKEEKSKAKKS